MKIIQDVNLVLVLIARYDVEHISIKRLFVLRELLNGKGTVRRCFS